MHVHARFLLNHNCYSQAKHNTYITWFDGMRVRNENIKVLILLEDRVIEVIKELQFVL